MASAKVPIRLAFCITDLDPGGAERALVQLVTRLDRNVWEAHVFCLAGPGALVAELQQADIPVTCLGARRSWQFWIVIRLARLLRKQKPSILQCFLFHANLVGRIAGRLARVKHIASGIRVAEKRSRLPLWLDRCTNWMVDRNVCVSRAVADFSIRAGLRADKVTVIPNGVDVERFRGATAADLQEFGIPPNSQTVIAVGRLDPQKNPTLLLDATQSLIPHHNQLHVLFVGDGPLAGELKQAVINRNLTDRIHFAGWKPNIAQLLKASFCLVLPSRWEGLPNAVLEAMAAGLPVISTRVEGTEDLVTPDVTGILIPPDSVDALEAALDRLLANPDSASSMGKNAQNQVEKDFTIEAMVANYDDFFRSLLET